MAIEHYVQEIY